ncbi:Holliday junction branch migration protein RuvA [Pseudobacteriovorax antillogorgiicola]|uniref:Holliday junction branch migration complex subunit RuvA n=1 Tax=Pseudobacteriovorax antillogorgiicola TaxID=1513793 RepID=A0A1Y6B3V5_9BACT|nr:Holliday junction branch migration protein RuvA [Pseudobacteriovorax antillogorgiicola]TCS59399.1 Holliday junction DNA helicase subunit RuvA [Pseudobacteriovorax antillogorgiicola]SME88649.1 Holliday junction DNA helicase subunit RuvA [Pseudobacteriovorax antillogorgiicola]
MYIEKLSGVYDTQLPTGIILNVNGVGYGLEMPLSSMCELPPLGKSVTLWTYTYVREDSIKLFGFLRYEDRVSFEVMLSLSGVGPKVALATLSTLSIAAIRRAIQYNDPKILVAVPGVGPRLAEKILIELKPKLEKLSNVASFGFDDGAMRMDEADFDHIHPEERFEARDAQTQILDDVRSALENLGFKDKAIDPIIKSIQKKADVTSFQDVMKHALKLLTDQGQKDPKKGSVRAPSASLDRELF